jgi:hypothetical protein
MAKILAKATTMKIFAVCVTTCLLANAASAAEVAALMREAIVNGSAQGEVSGPIGDATRQKLNATGPLSIQIKMVYAFVQPGCARLQLDFKQSDALPPNATLPSEYTFASQVSVCLDGQAPTSLKRKS